jgi:hypothetical protein
MFACKVAETSSLQYGVCATVSIDRPASARSSSAGPSVPCYSEVGCLASRAKLLAIGRGAGADAAVRPAFSCSACHRRRRGRRVVVGLAAPREGLDDDRAATAAATRTRHRAGFVGGCGRGGLDRFRAGRHDEQLARPCEVGGAIAVGEQSIVADAVQALGRTCVSSAGRVVATPVSGAMPAPQFIGETDSPAEGTGFERSVPRDTTNLSMSPLVGSPPTEKSERKRTDTRSAGPFPQRNRWFESGSLPLRVKRTREARLWQSRCL